MDHVAILDSKRKLLPKILSGEKTIESRWTKTKRAPYGKIAKGDVVYFKDAARPVTVRAKVSDVLFFCDPDLPTLKMIGAKYAKAIGFSHEYDPKKITARYVTLVFLDEVKSVEPFNIDKTGFGNANAWLLVKNIDSIRV